MIFYTWCFKITCQNLKAGRGSLNNQISLGICVRIFSVAEVEGALLCGG